MTFQQEAAQEQNGRFALQKPARKPNPPPSDTFAETAPRSQRHGNSMTVCGQKIRKSRDLAKFRAQIVIQFRPAEIGVEADSPLSAPSTV